jgi:Tfp pilus assembly protein PilF
VTVTVVPLARGEYHGLARRHLLPLGFLMRPLLNGGTLIDPNQEMSEDAETQASVALEEAKAFYLERRWSDALHRFERALSLDDGLDEAVLWLAITLARKRDLSGAEGAFRRLLLRPGRTAIEHAYFGDFLATNDRFDEAEQQFLIALSLDPECKPALRDYANLCWVLDRDDDAERLLRNALAIDPDDKYSLYSFGTFLSFFPSRRKEADFFLDRAQQAGHQHAAQVRLDVRRARRRYRDAAD